MARLPTRDDLGGLPSARSGRVIANYDTSAAGRGLADLGASIAGAATDIARMGGVSGSGARGPRVSQAEQFEAQRRFLEFTSAQEQAYEESKSTVDPGAFGFREKAQQNYLNAAKEFFTSIPDALKPEYDMKLFQTEDALLSRSRAFETTERTRYYGEEVNKGLGTLENKLFSNPGDFDKNFSEGVSFINAIPDESLSRIQKADLVKQWRTKAQLASLNGVTPQERIRLLGGIPDEIQGASKPSANTARLSHAVYGRAQQTAGYFQSKHGLSPIAAAAVAGHAVQESGVKASGAVGDSGTAFGVFQWRGDRLANLKKFAASNGRNWQDIDTQLDFAAWEGQNGDAGARRAWAELQSAQTLEDAVAAWMHFERPQGYTPGNPRGGHAYESRLAAARRIAGGEGGGEGIPALDAEGGIMNAQFDAARADPRFADMNYVDADKIIRGAQSEIAGQLNASAAAAREREAAQKVQYDQYKGALELALETGELNSELSILNDELLTDAHKADLIKAFRAKQEQGILTGEAVRLFSEGALNVDPYDSKGKKTVDNVWGALTKGADEDTDMGPVAEDLVRQTGTVPQQVVNSIRKGATSTDPEEVANAARTAQRLSAVDPAALARRDGGSEAQKLADTYSHYVNNMDLSPEEAAQKIIDMRDPEKVRQRDAILKSEPVKKALKAVSASDVAAIFDEGFWSSAPDVGGIPSAEAVKVGVNAESEAAIVADYRSILEESIAETNGDMDAAKELAKQRFQRNYGVSGLSPLGSSIVIKYPPEKAYPAMPDGSQSYIRDQAIEALKGEGVESDAIYLQPYDGTEQDIKSGKPARYQIFYEHDGRLQQFFLPFFADPSAANAEYKARQDVEMREAEQRMLEQRTEEQQRFPEGRGVGRLERFQNERLYRGIAREESPMGRALKKATEERDRINTKVQAERAEEERQRQEFLSLPEEEQRDRSLGDFLGGPVQLPRK